MKSELTQLKLEKQRMQEAKDREKLEDSIREDAERAFKIRMEEMQGAQEEAQKELAAATAWAERTTRDPIEEERKAEAERQKQRAEMTARAERKARQRFEKKVLERKQRHRSWGLPVDSTGPKR